MSSNHDRESPGSTGRDAAVARAWRQVSDEQPPTKLDDSIVAAARKAVSDEGAEVKVIRAGRRSLQWLLRWQPLAAAATVAGLAFVLLQVLPRDRDVAPSIRMEAPASATVPKESRSPTAREADDASVAAAAVSPPEEWAEAADRPAMSDGTASRHATEAVSSEASVAEPAGPTASELEAAPAPAQSAAGVGPRSAADRAASVAALLASGDAAGAADELRAFRAADPDADSYLPESLRAWARTVK